MMMMIYEGEERINTMKLLHWKSHWFFFFFDTEKTQKPH